MTTIPYTANQKAKEIKLKNINLYPHRRKGKKGKKKKTKA